MFGMPCKTVCFKRFAYWLSKKYKIIMDENDLLGKVKIKQAQISVETDAEKKRILNSELVKLRLRLELLKQDQTIKNLKSK